MQQKRPRSPPYADIFNILHAIHPSPTHRSINDLQFKEFVSNPKLF